ncbi:hypothetical protein MFIFM68171_03542 [Madurella fahalii]|uniref:BHLH domain-containing protein n=1 Tax=Madurella fahalii TaxID=1157608 RepID=A0ABQ0G6E1_9PEZI
MDPRRPLGRYRELGYGGSGHGNGGLPFGYGVYPPEHEAQDTLVPPPTSGPELLNNDEQTWMSNFWNSIESIDDSAMPGESLLGGIYTDNWCFPQVVGHNVSYGTAANTLAETTYPSLAGIPLHPWGIRSPDNVTLTAGSNAGQSNAGTGTTSLQNGEHWGLDHKSSMAATRQPQHGLGEPNPSPEVIAAATALSSRHAHMSDLIFSSTHDMPPHAGHSAGSSQHQGFGGPSSNADQLPPNSDRSSSFSRAMFSDPFQTQSYPARPRPPVDEVRFGSDPSFNRVNFVPRSAKETTEAISAEQLATLGCLQRNVSAAPTRAPSPVAFAPPSPSRLVSMSSIESPVRLKTLTHPLTPDEPEYGESDQPRKRRRSTKTTVASPQPSSASLPAAQQPNSPVQGQRRSTSTAAASAKRPSTTTPAPRKRKQPGAAPLTPETEAAAAVADSRRRKSSATASGGKAAVSSSSSSAAKQPRANLTDEQKRENHIRSEQKRRDLIKDHFNDLGAIVPALKSGGYSKAAMLNLSADWLVEVMQANERLMERVRAKGGTVRLAD